MTMDQLESKMFEAIRETTIRDIGNDELAGYIRGIVDFDLELRKVLEKGIRSNKHLNKFNFGW